MRLTVKSSILFLPWWIYDHNEIEKYMEKYGSSVTESQQTIQWLHLIIIVHIWIKIKQYTIKTY